MDFHLANFAVSIEVASDLVQTRALWLDAMHQLGFTGAAMGAHVDARTPPRGAYVFCDLPVAWIAYCGERHCSAVNPIWRADAPGLEAFVWCDPHFLAALPWRQRRIMGRAHALGLRFGVTRALSTFNHFRASYSLFASAPEMSGDVLQAAHTASVLAHCRAARLAAKLAPTPSTGPLSRRERQCLEELARGRTDSEVGRCIGISTSAAYRAIERARARLRARTRGHAVYLALQYGLIAP